MSERSAAKSHVNPMTALACGVRGMGGARSCATDSPSRGGIVVETSGRYSEIAFPEDEVLVFDKLTGFAPCCGIHHIHGLCGASGNEITLRKSLPQIETE